MELDLSLGARYFVLTLVYNLYLLVLVIAQTSIKPFFDN